MFLGAVLSPDHAWRTEVDELGNVVFDGRDSAALSDAIRAPLDVLLLDVAEIRPDDIPAIRNYRIARPRVRIVVSVPADARPGDRVLAGLVAMGVWDLCQGSSLADALDRAPTYADAARWEAGDAYAASHGSPVVPTAPELPTSPISLPPPPATVTVVQVPPAALVQPRRTAWGAVVVLLRDLRGILADAVVLGAILFVVLLAWHAVDPHNAQAATLLTYVSRLVGHLLERLHI